MQEENKDVMIPIRAIVENSMKKNGAKYMEDEFNLLRKYYIACLNLRYLVPNELEIMVDKFSSKIKFVILNYNGINKLDYYKISGGVLYINGSLKLTSSDLYDVTFYKAVTEVIFGECSKYQSFNNALCQMIAEKVYNMSENGMAMIMPVLKKDTIGDVVHSLRTGYNNYTLVITLLKQFLLYKGKNENILIRNIFLSNYDSLIEKEFSDNDSKLLLEALDKIFILDIDYRINKRDATLENILIEKYQIIINGLFTEIKPSYYAFLVLLTTDKLKKICDKTQNKEEV